MQQEHQDDDARETRNAEHAINNHPRGDTTPDRP